MTDSFLEPLALDLMRIDCGYIRAGAAACYLLVRDGEAALIDTGTSSTLARVLAAMAVLQVPRDKLRYVIPTHVHLDHAGGAGMAMQAFPNAQLVIHPRGARHMVDPSKLIDGVKQVYGDEAFKRLYGQVLPVDRARVIEAPDETTLLLGNTPLQFIDTPGHARHHFCVWDVDGKNLFTGDTAGISYTTADSDAGPTVLATTTPVQFEPDAWLASLARLQALPIKQLLLTHFGAVTQVSDAFKQLANSIEHHVNVALENQNNEDRVASMAQQLLSDWSNLLEKRGVKLDAQAVRQTYGIDAQLNAQGLDVWLQRQEN